MYIFKKIAHLQAHLNSKRKEGKQIGFVPTMGALHLGHLSLLKIAQKQNNYTVASIFVNPTQFGDANDLELYPRPIENDILKLQNQQCDVLFLPEASEVYPDNHQPCRIDLNGLDQSMEGAFRPGHFEGVVEVVKRLLDIVQPDHLIMGQKDYQQFAIIKHLINTLDLPVQLVMGPIVREPDGLAMSSRNIRLSEQGRRRATKISKALMNAQKEAKSLDLQQVKNNAIQFMKSEHLDINYFEIVDGNTLEKLDSFAQAAIVTACTTVQIDGVRLLDNIILKNEES